MKAALTKEIFHVPVYAWGVGLAAFGVGIFLFLRRSTGGTVGSVDTGAPNPIFPFSTNTSSSSPPSPVSHDPISHAAPQPLSVHSDPTSANSHAMIPSTNPVIVTPSQSNPVLRAVPGKQPQGYNAASDAYSTGKMATTTYSKKKKVPQQYHPKPNTFTKPAETRRLQQASATQRQVVKAGGPVHQ